MQRCLPVVAYPSLMQCGRWLRQPSGWDSGPRLDWLSPGSHQWTGGRGEGGGHAVVAKGGPRLCAHCHIPDLVPCKPPQHLKECLECLCLVLCACTRRGLGVTHASRAQCAQGTYVRSMLTTCFHSRWAHLGVGPPAPASYGPRHSVGGLPPRAGPAL